MTLEERAQIDDLAEWLDNNADGAEDAGALAHNCTRWFPALVSLREQLAHGCLDEMHLVAVTNLPIVEAERDALREQLSALTCRCGERPNDCRDEQDVVSKVERALIEYHNAVTRNDAVGEHAWLIRDCPDVVRGWLRTLVAAARELQGERDALREQWEKLKKRIETTPPARKGHHEAD